MTKGPVWRNISRIAAREISGRSGAKENSSARTGSAYLRFDLLTGTSNFPLRLMTFSGFFIALFGVLFGLVVFVISQIDKSWGAEGVFALFAIAFVLMGCQFIGLGLLGEYVGKIHHNTRQRPQFFVEQVIVGQPQAAATDQTPEQKLAG